MGKLLTYDPEFQARRRGAGRVNMDLDLPEVVRGDRGRYFYRWGSSGRMLPVLAGADDPTINPVEHPLGAPTIQGANISVDVLLQQPTRVTTFIMDITLARFILDRLFTSAGGVTGGAVVYDVVVANDIFLARDVEPVAPGSEFPIVTSIRRVPRVAAVEKYGGKFWISYEARDRNDQITFRNELVRLGNTIVRKLNQRGVTALNAAIANNGGSSTYVGNNWETAIPSGAYPTPPQLTPGADFAKPQMLADQAELGIQYDVALVNPVQLNTLRLFYEDRLEQMLQDHGYDELYASNRVPVGSMYAVASGQLGEMRLEQPLQTATWDEQGRQRLWTQSSVRPVMYVQNPFAVMQVTAV